MKKYSRERVFAIVGMGVSWLPLIDRLLFPVSFTYANTGDVSVYLYNVVYWIMAIVLTLAIGLHSRKAKRSPIVDKRVVLVTGIGGSVGVALTAFLSFSSPISSFFIGLGVMLVALYVPVHFLFWSLRFVQMPRKGVLTDASLSFVFASLLFALPSSFGASTMVFSLLSPLVSAVLGFVVPRVQLRGDDSGLRLASRGETLFIASLVLVLLCNLAIAYFNNSAQLQADLPLRSLIFWGGAVAFCAVSFVCRFDRKQEYMLTKSFALVSLILVGMLFVAVFASDAQFNAGTVPLHCANAVLNAFAWLLLICEIREKRENALFALSLYLGGVLLLLRFVQACVMYLPGLLAGFVQGVSSVHLAMAFSFAAICLVICVLFRVFGNEGSSDAEDVKMGDDSVPMVGVNLSEEYVEEARRMASFDVVIRSLQQEVSLSVRESEIARLAFRGYSVKKMAQELCVSENTIYSHFKHIYQKTGTHSRQEFLDYLEQRL